MKVRLLVGFICFPAIAFAFKLPVERNISLTDTILKFDANPALGFNYVYFIRVPKGVDLDKKQFLLVETNNNGVHDSISFHENGAYLTAKRNSLAASLCPGLKLPLLVPAFPRPEKDWKYYTHAFDRDAALLKDNDMARLDLQLIAMIKDAREQLKRIQLSVHDKILMNGFSASGTFANRFTLVHPELVAAVACGGINAMPILPVKKIGNHNLVYPVGISDFTSIFHDTVHITEYKKVPQFIYMGAKDSNDAVLFDDAYSDKERAIIYRTVGKQMQPDRWNNCQSIYTREKVNVTFRTYPNIGHQTDREVFDDVSIFFRKVMQSFD